MKTLVGRRSRYLVGIWCATALASAWAQEPGIRVTPELLQSRIAAVQDSSELDEASKTRLVDLYRQSISNLATRRANQEATEEYRQARLNAPAETEKVRATLERRSATDPTADLQISSSTPSDRLTRKLDEETANLMAVESRLAVLETRLEAEAQRPGRARARIAAARAQMEDLAAQSRDRAAPNETPQIAEAARWAAETRLEALRTEIASLDQELLSYEARNELLKAQREEAAQSVSRIVQRVDVLRAAVNERRRMEAELAMAQARAALEGAASGEPLVRELAEANLALVELLQEQVEELDELGARERNLPGTSQIENAYRSARRKLELEGWQTPVGLVILAQRRQLPSAREYVAERRVLSRSIAGVSLRRIEADEERRALTDISAYLERRIAEAGREAPEAAARGELENLLTTRRSLLDRAIANDTALQRRLYDLDDALRRLTDRTTAYDELLAEHLLWVRSTRAVDAAALARLPAEVASYLRPGPWLETLREAAVGLVRAPVFLLMALAALALAFRRGQIRASLAESGQNVGRVEKDSMKSTLGALAFTLMLAAPVPLVLGAIGGSLSTADEAAAFPNAVGSVLVKVAAWLAFPVALRALLEPGGVAHRHIGWDVGPLAEARRQLAWFIGLVIPFYFVLLTSIAVETRPATSGGTLTLLCFVAVLAGLVALITGIGHPTKGVVGRVLASRSGGAGWRWRYLGFPLAVLVPVAMVALALFGFTYTAEDLMRRLFQSIWSLAVIWLGAALVRRWLLMTGRRLVHQEALAAGDADRAPHDGEASEGLRVGDDIGSPEVDLVALDADSRKLLSASVLLTVALVLFGIWGDVIPALGILENVELWSKQTAVDGIEQSVPVTLADLLLAAVIAAGGYILARNLPSLFDIILLKQGSLTAGGRYTVETLTRYMVTAVAALAVLQVLGASGSQLGWAAAALGVGIGFGLQEIVANFICGLILLFERPVRIGDVVTIGDASGVVSRIRIRATTIRDWEQKELVVPNKELITGRLLNWTLSDAVTRVFITVGVAYGSDVERAMALIREAAEENPRVVDDPEPVVHFEQFADSSLNLTLRAYTAALSDRLPAITELHKAIDQKFRAAGIVIAFPQRDVHFHSGVGGTVPPTVDSGGSGNR